jgi:hypothetical protein
MSETGGHDSVTVSAEGVRVDKRFAADAFPVPAIAFEITSGRDEQVTVRLSESVPPGVETKSLGFHPDYGSEHWTVDGGTLVFERGLEPGGSFTTVYGVDRREAGGVEQFLTEPTIEAVDPPLREEPSYDSVGVSVDGVSIQKSYSDEFPIPAIAFEVISERDDPMVLRLSDWMPDGVDTENIGLHPGYGAEFWTIGTDSVTFEREFEPGEQYTTVYGVREDCDIEQLLTEPAVEVVPSSTADRSELVQATPAEALQVARTTLEESLDEADALLTDADGDGEIETVLATVEDVEAAIDTAREVTRLRTRCDELRERARRQRCAAPPETVPDPPELSLSYDQIDLGEQVGAGGSAEVYRATASAADDEVDIAVKRARADSSRTLHVETVERMMDEAETWQRLDGHDHIVSVLGYGSEPLPWIGMEYMNAGHLGERVGDLSFEQALWTAIATTRAIRHAHDRGVVHLDLKPANILFRSVEGAWDVPKVADWGLSTHLLEHSQGTEGFSPAYAAPEQFDGTRDPVDHVTDIYQLGAVCYELFTGHLPSSAESGRFEQPAPPSEVADVPAALDEVLLTALATDKTDRYEHVLYLRDALQDLSG